MRLKILAAAVCLALMCSCNAASFSGTEALLEAPKLNKRQVEVSRALETTLSLRSIVYIYPRSGDYRSPFIFYDFDGDGMEEAIVFYSRSDASGNVRAKVLTQDEDGSWSPFYDVALPESSQIDFVRFDRITDKDSACMLIGCQSTGRSKTSSLAVYSMKAGEVPLTEITAGYIHYSVQDFDGDGLSEIVIINRESSRGRFYAALLRGVSGRIAAVSQVSLVSEVESVLAMCTGRLWDDNSTGVYIDEILGDSPNPTVATEIIRVSASGLGMLCGGEPAGPEQQESLARSNYGDTFRDDEVICRDFDGDGVVEVPFPLSLPGSEEDSNTSIPKLIDFMHLTPEGFDIRRSAVINAEADYFVYFPDRWIGRVTIESDPETAEWHFHKWNPDIPGPAEELLRVRVTSAQDPPDMFEEYIPLETRGTAAYSAYIPKISGEELAVTKEEVEAMFNLLPA